MSKADQPTAFPLLANDPQPTLVLDQRGQIIASTRSVQLLMADAGLSTPEAMLPVNTVHLIRAALTQNRAIENVESRFADLNCIWNFIPDADNQQVIARGREATREIRLREQAQRSNRLYRLITENTTDLISRHAPDGRFIDATPASWQLLGYRPEALRGKTLEEVFNSEQAARKLAEAQEKLREEGYATLTLNITHSDGKVRYLEISSRAIRETYTGAVVEVISVSRDITSRVESEEKNRLLADELAHTTRLATLGELASSVAHEMNQPLASIVNFASASQRFLQGAQHQPARLAKVEDGLEKIVHHANRASEVIKRLRAFLRKGQKRTAPIAVNEVAANVARLVQWEAEKKRVRIVESLTDSQPIITADPVLLEQVLINLIRNAIDASVEARQNGSKIQAELANVVIETRVNDKGEVLLEVTDEGEGLSEEAIRQIFQPFYTSKPQGLGLGLSMSRSIIEDFGGFLDATPASTGGLTLTCRFPATAQRNTPVTKENSDGEPNGEF
ncbi:MAG: PAS domain S-box protein [Alteromonadaceae bacterium]|nr:PAS domain S-box protein [Alteromonadaceae bacterium]